MKRDIIWIVLWIASIMFVLLGMTAYQKGISPEWWPMWLGGPGCCLTWIGVMTNAIMCIVLSNPEET